MPNLKNIIIPRYLVILGLITLCFIYLFVKLSIWQFARAEEKKIILQKISNINNSNYNNKLNNILELNNAPEYTKVDLYGYFDYKNTIFLSSQYSNHKFGYHVITPFILNNMLDNNQNRIAILVDRGWVDSLNNLDRYFNNNNIKLNISGIIKNSNNNQYIMGNNLNKINNINKNIYIIQKINPESDKTKKIFPYQIADTYIRLISPKSHGYILNWQWTNISPEKHFAYAIQWILLAISILLLYSYLCYKAIEFKAEFKK